MATDRLMQLMKVTGGLALAAPALVSCDAICGACGACCAAAGGCSAYAQGEKAPGCCAAAEKSGCCAAADKSGCCAAS
ncbi:hypothetical protein ACFCW2_03955 [Qipengyuania sp. DSG2-2]|uniref:hypothetical protein n=1 Tax=Qipengyuania sp. DGS2-2 TaxID=3349631 RepID=UPI0036D29D6C